MVIKEKKKMSMTKKGLGLGLDIVALGIAWEELWVQLGLIGSGCTSIRTQPEIGETYPDAQEGDGSYGLTRRSYVPPLILDVDDTFIIGWKTHPLKISGMWKSADSSWQLPSVFRSFSLAGDSDCPSDGELRLEDIAKALAFRERSWAFILTAIMSRGTEGSWLPSDEEE
ncbi:hypothetical protein QJS10_CPA02g00961 [Acorus calamus]|uniref:Uncharacterized protein n=1 Tax=Acorus calamus TaxID=4465 RepID=A0AAV9FGT5_ACOCL|nr:hypothetical protein QJS10_CPA02g00961 [Acorus calamus]